MIILCHQCENTSIISAKVKIVFQPSKKGRRFVGETIPLFVT